MKHFFKLLSPQLTISRSVGFRLSVDSSIRKTMNRRGAMKDNFESTAVIDRRRLYRIKKSSEEEEAHCEPFEWFVMELDYKFTAIQLAAHASNYKKKKKQ